MQDGNAPPRETDFVHLPPPERIVVRAVPAWKRLMDVVGAGLGLILLSPVMLAAAIAVRATSEGPVIYRQKRAGLGGRPFVLYKFRSMCIGADAMKKELLKYNEAGGTVFKIRRDPRITRVGRIMRKFSIDELPQLWNVLKGDMSLVGPRALPLDEIPCGAGLCDNEEHLCRLSVTPGLTCYWQVMGRSLLDFEQWVELDGRYIRERSFLTDIKILLMTIPAVLSGRGAH